MIGTLAPRAPLAELSLALGALFCIVPAAQAQTRALSWDDYYRIHSVGNVALSPDGSRIAFVRSRVLEEENRTHAEVWLVDSDGRSAPRRLTSPATEARNPRWSADGRLLAFSSSRSVAGERSEGSTWFLRMDAPGEAFQIEGLAGAPVFDPTNRWIAFSRPVPPAGPSASEPALGPEERKIVERFDGRAYEWMQFRFDGRGYLPDPTDPAATPPAQVFVLPRDGGVARQLTHLEVDASDLAWSPDGRRLAFVADAFQRDEYQYERADLWTVSVEGETTRLTDDAYTYGSPAWSPDGSWIAVQGQVGLDVVIRERWDHGAPSDLWILRPDGSDRRNLTEAWDLIPDAPSWSADGRSLYFTAGVGGNSHLFRVGLDGQVVQLTDGDVRIGSVSYAPVAERFAFTRTGPTHPGDVFTASADGAPRQLTQVNDELLAELDLGVPERLQFRSADGTAVEGWLLPPAGYAPEPRGAWPMILNLHGGPHGAYGNSFSFDFQMQRARGFFVLYTNPRASTGYGEAFRWGTWGSWGDEDYEDVMAGVDHALAHYPIDEARLGVTGYSYGGYLTNWIITQTDRFAAAATGAGISNWMSDYATSDIPRTKESEFYGAPWEKEGLENLLASSPIVHAEGVSTPTLFVHGESDHRVPIEEAEQMYVALRKQNVPARMVRYPETSHGGWTAWRYLHRLYSTAEWWDRWLKPGPVS